MSYIRWTELDKTLSAEDTIRSCFTNGMSSTNGVWVRRHHIGFRANYSGYGYVTVEELDKCPTLCQWFDGLVVTWLDTFWDDRTLPIKKIPVDQLDEECLAVFNQKVEELKPFIYHHRREELLLEKA